MWNKNIENEKGVWDIFADGKTKGIFQLESSLGKNWSKKLKPESLEQLSALISILRPGSLKAIIDDKSITQHYVDRRHNKEPVVYIDDNCKEILEYTLGLMLYQEQSMQIAQKVAGFSGVDADRLRKSIGKKDAALMIKLRDEFINGCIKTGVITKEKAEEIFDIIEKSARYQFNACLDPNTFVETDRGEIKTLDELSIGEKILCPTEDGDKFIEVLNFMESGDKELYEVELEDGFSITCSLDHEFMCEDSIKRPLSEILENNHKIMSKEQAKRIIGVKSVGIKRSVDIEVDSKEHLFYGNGIATSNSHAYSYAKTSLATAYMKYHYPLEFFTACLEYSGEKQDKNEEVYELISEARNGFGINIKMCDMFNMCELYKMDRKTNTIYFGLKSIKSLTNKRGEECNLEIENFSKNNKNPSWIDVLIDLSTNIVSTNFKALCSVGFFDNIGKESRTRKLYEYNIFKNINDKEILWIKEQRKNGKTWKDLILCLKDLSPTKKEGGGTNTIGRMNFILNEIMLLEKPPYDLDKDDPNWVLSTEKELLGCEISIDKYSMPQLLSTTTCDRILNAGNSTNLKNVRICCTITKINFHTIKKEGQNKDREMAFLTIKDDTGELDSVVMFPDAKEEYRFSLFEDNNVLLTGDVKDGSLIVYELKEITE